MTATTVATHSIEDRLAVIQKNYEQAKGISQEDLAWLLRKVEQGIVLAKAGQNLALAAKTLTELQKVRIKTLEAELAERDS